MLGYVGAFGWFSVVRDCLITMFLVCVGFVVYVVALFALVIVLDFCFGFVGCVGVCGIW